ncbi:ComF family protein [Thalassotalea fusca]
MKLISTLRNYADKVPHVINRHLLTLSRCDLCRQDVSQFHLLCDHCYQDLPTFNYPNLSNNLLSWPKIRKAISHQHLDQLYVLSPYLWPFDYWLKQLKYSQRFEYAKLLGQLLYQQWHTDVCQQANTQLTQGTLHIPVAIHPKRWGKRGYNQSHLIAKHFCRLGGLRYSNRLLMRIHHQASQVGQDGAARRRQLHGAFALNAFDSPVPDAVVIVDDVVTTGSTVNEIAKLLKKNGVQHVGVIAIALALPQ